MQIEIRITAETFSELVTKLTAALQELMPPAIEQAANEAAGAEQKEQSPVAEPERRRRKTPVDKSECPAPVVDEAAGEVTEPAQKGPTRDEVRKLAVGVAERHSGRTTVVVEAIMRVAGVKTLAEVPSEKLGELRDALLAIG